MAIWNYTYYALSRQLLKQHFGLLQIRGVELPGKPGIDLLRQLVGYIVLALEMLQMTQARAGSQLQRFRLPAADNVDDPTKASFRLVLVRGFPHQQELPLEPVQLSFVERMPNPASSLPSRTITQTPTPWRGEWQPLPAP